MTKAQKYLLMRHMAKWMKFAGYNREKRRERITAAFQGIE